MSVCLCVLAALALALPVAATVSNPVKRSQVTEVLTHSHIHLKKSLNQRFSFSAGHTWEQHYELRETAGSDANKLINQSTEKEAVGRS